MWEISLMNYKTIIYFCFIRAYLQITSYFGLKKVFYQKIKMRFIWACLCFKYVYNIDFMSLYL